MKKILGVVIAVLAVVSVAVIAVMHFSADTNVFADAPEPRLTLIVDAGHGGEDSGAIAPSGMQEAEVNLDVAERIDALAAFFGVTTVMTRESAEIRYSRAASTTRERKAEDQNARLKLARKTDNAVFLSIHQNFFTAPEPFGAQALYASSVGSEAMGKTMQTLFLSALNPDNRRAAELIADNIMLMNNIDYPAVLVECGFLSNPGEEMLLATEDYRLKLAAVITAGFLQERENLERIYETGDTA